MLQVYTGDGKGKTTAAIGLAIRALGAGMKVYIMQFMKSLTYSEQKILGDLEGVELHTTGKPFFVAEEGMLTAEELAAWGNDVVVFPPGKPPQAYKELLGKGFQEAAAAALSGAYQLVILDEANTALFFGLLAREAVEAMLDRIPPDIEVVLTGRKAPSWLLDKADLVTEMREIKHYYQQGVQARKGIEN
jgi:cob(I)alamin adenosyltransferase